MTTARLVHRLRKMLLGLCVPSLLVGSLSLYTPAALASDHDDAREHFDAGVRAFDEQRFADAATEFEQAYRAKPAWQVLFNLGSVYAALGRPVEAVKAFEGYLREGSASIDAARHHDVEAELARQRQKIAQLEITVSEPNAEIRVDARLVGRSPLTEALRLAEGTHVVEVGRSGRRPERRELALRGGELVKASFTLLVASEESPSKPVQGVKDAPRPTGSAVGSGQRIAGYIIGGGGVIGAATGIFILADGQSKHLDAVSTANQGDRPRAERLESDADHQKNVGYATVAISGAVLLGGIVLLFTAPSDSSTRVASQLAPWASSTAGGLELKGTW
jgi:hypothetical protein